MRNCVWISLISFDLYIYNIIYIYIQFWLWCIIYHYDSCRTTKNKLTVPNTTNLTPCSSQNHPSGVFLFIVLDVHRDEDGVTSLRPKHWGLQPRNLVTEWSTLLVYPGVLKWQKTWLGSSFICVSLLNHLFHEYYVKLHCYMSILVFLCCFFPCIRWFCDVSPFASPISFT